MYEQFQQPQIKACSRATKIWNKEPARAPKTYDAYGNSLYAYVQWRNDRISCSFYTFEKVKRMFVNRW